MSQQNKWYYKWNDGSYRPYDSNVTNWLNNATVGDSTVLQIGQNKYQMLKLSHTDCTQTNIRSRYDRKGISQSKYDQMYGYQNQNHGNNYNNNQHMNYQSNNNQNIQNTYNQQNQMDDDMKQTPATWHFMDNNGKFQCMDSVVSKRIDKLNIGDTMRHNTLSGQYELKKISNTKGQQRNVETNNICYIRKMNSYGRQQYNKNPNNKPKQNSNTYHTISNRNSNDQTSNNYDEKKQESVKKWYWKTDDGKYKPMNDNMSQRLSDLTIGESMKTKISNAMYEFKKTAIGKGQQRNIRTNKSRDICVAKYGWFYEDNSKSLKPFTDQLSQKITNSQIGSSFTFSLKSGAKYQVTKTSKNQGKQKNLSTNFERKIVYKMTLNDSGDGQAGNNWSGSISTGQKGRDWVKEREKKAMKTGKVIRCKLTQKRNLFEDTADAHFRRCESQFMRSCTNAGLSTNGLNSTIKEVEYIINPKLIKKFEAKKKQLMSKNKWKDESKLNIILAWHGTPNTNVSGIVETNFSLNKLASNSGDTGWYGKGIYFSEYAKISLGYGKGLLLCKVMLGKSHKMLTSQQQTGRSCEKGYDSHTVVSANGMQYGQEIVIFDVDQILPCYIVKY